MSTRRIYHGKKSSYAISTNTSHLIAVQYTYIVYILSCSCNIVYLSEVTYPLHEIYNTTTNLDHI